jgi:ABC-type sugar transport system permease subunit
MMSTHTELTVLPKALHRRHGGRNLRGGSAPYLFIAPFYVLYALFMIVPVIAAVVLSTTEWVGIGTPTFVGLDNYLDLARDTSFGGALANSGVYTLIAVLVVVPVSLLVAQGLGAHGLKFRDAFRVAYFVPMVISPIVIALIFSLILDRDYGLLNASLHALFFLAALQNVPKELYEAAALDGAGRWRTFLTVTLPSIRPVAAFVVVTSFISAAQLFDEPYLLTKGGPGESTLSVAMFIFRAAFERQQFGYAAAAGVVLFAVVFVVSQALNRILGIGRDQ